MGASKKTKNSPPPSLSNRKAFHNYTINSKLEVGIILQGSEVKSLRKGQGSIIESHAGLSKDEIFLYNAFIPEYREANRFNHSPKRPRKLLLHKREIKKLTGQIQRRGMTLIPLKVYFNEKGKVKVELGIASGKTQFDKRATQKEKDWQRQKERLLKDSS
jgi:SsrA-binding protein